MVYLADTNLLIRLWRDARTPERLRDLTPFLDNEIRLVWVVKAEFLRGAVIAGHDHTLIGEFLERYKTLWPDEETLGLYARIYPKLREQKMCCSLANSAALHREPHARNELPVKGPIEPEYAASVSTESTKLVQKSLGSTFNHNSERCLTALTPCHV